MTDTLSILVHGTTLGTERVGTERVPVVVEPGQEFGAVPVSVFSFPFTSRPQHIRPVLQDKLV